MDQILLRRVSFAGAIAALLLFLAPFCIAVSINGDNQQVTFKPNLVWTYSYGVAGADRIDSYVTGDLPNVSSIVSIMDSNPGGGPRGISAKFTFPESLPPGTYQVYLGAKERPPDGATIGGVAAIQLRIRIKVLYPGKWIDVGFTMPNGNENEIIPVNIAVVNNGIDNLSTVNGKIDFYTNNGTYLKTSYTNTIPILSDTTGQLLTTLNSSGLVPDYYTATLTVYYDDKSLPPIDSTFRIGTPSLAITGYTSSFAKDAINKLDIQVQSGWNGQLEQVYGVVDVHGKSLQTPTTTVDKFGQAALSTYWETQGLNYGTYPATITVHYSYRDQQGHAQELTTTTDATFNITASKEPQDQRPQELKGTSALTLNTSMLLYLLLALLVLINIVYLLRRRSPPRSQPPSPPR